MKLMKRFPLLFLGFALAMIFVSACSQPATSNLTTLQIIQNSVNAMKNVQAAHEDFNVTLQTSDTNVNGSNLQIPPNVTVKGSGDESLTKAQQQMNLAVTLPTLSTQVSDIVSGDKVYVKVGQSQWYVLDKPTFDQSGGALVSNLLSDTTLNENNLLSVVQNINITDHGDEILNGQSLRHITAKLDKSAFEKWLASNPQWNNLLNALGGNTTLNSASADLYIDESQFYVHRTEVKVDLNTNNNGKTATTTVDFVIDLSNFNEPVTITTPANATPVTDPQQLLNALSGSL